MTKEKAWEKSKRGIEMEDSKQDVWYNGYDVGYQSRDEEMAELKKRIEECHVFHHALMKL